MSWTVVYVHTDVIASIIIAPKGTQKANREGKANFLKGGGRKGRKKRENKEEKRTKVGKTG